MQSSESQNVSSKQVMARDLDASTKTLGIFFCFVLIAYIFSFLGSHSLQNQPKENTIKSCERPCCRQPGVPTTQKQRQKEEYGRGIARSELLEAKRIMSEAREMERRMKSEMEQWEQERRLEMKGWREEQLRWLWGSKQKNEKGIFGWFGGSKKNGGVTL